ncbi:MAG TPA: ATP-binding cassette domain-containing protein, partial [Acidimicrobiales bacterium]|nr:ATP-binding cassette domain-containing protein [Acidimicrobiales bacterium]
MVSLAQAAFVTSAAMIAGLLIAHRFPFAASLLAGVAVSVVLGVIVSLPAIRLGGLYLALATLALGLICDDVVFDIGPLFNQNQGWTIPAPSIGPLHFDSPRSKALLLFILVGLGVLVVRNLQRSVSGRAAYALRSAPTAAGSSGVSATRIRVSMFIVSASLAGLGGVLYASFDGSIQPTNFPAQTSLLWLAIIVTLGIRRPGYAVIAGLVSTVFPYVLTFWTTSTAIPQILFGLGGVALAKSPDGSIAHMKRALFAFRRKRQQVRAAQMEPTADAVPIVEPVRVSAVGSDPGAAPLLRLEQLTAGYHGIDVLHGITLDLGPGQLLGVLGSNGAGKSTLCSVISGGNLPSGGRILFADQDATTRPPYWRSRRGLLVAPEARGIFGGLTVDENLRILLPRREDRDQVYDRFPALAERRPIDANVLSGGEQQILALAPLLVHRPRVLIADEPYLGLAPQIVKLIMTLLAELRDDGVAVVLVEEKSRDVLPIADKIAVLQLGRIVWTGTPDEIGAEELAAMYLGVGATADGGAPARVWERAQTLPVGRLSDNLL